MFCGQACSQKPKSPIGSHRPLQCQSFKIWWKNNVFFKYPKSDQFSWAFDLFLCLKHFKTVKRGLFIKSAQQTDPARDARLAEKAQQSRKEAMRKWTWLPKATANDNDKELFLQSEVLADLCVCCCFLCVFFILSYFVSCCKLLYSTQMNLLGLKCRAKRGTAASMRKNLYIVLGSNRGPSKALRLKDKSFQKWCFLKMEYVWLLSKFRTAYTCSSSFPACWRSPWKSGAWHRAGKTEDLTSSLRLHDGVVRTSLTQNRKHKTKKKRNRLRVTRENLLKPSGW